MRILQSLNDVILFCVLVNFPVRLTFAFQNTPWTMYKRSGEPTDDQYLEGESPILGCHAQELRSLPGTYVFSSDGLPDFCSLYLLAPVDHVIEMEFTYFNVGCQEDGAVALLDGWELDYEIFPSEEDHQLPMSLRYLPFCGEDTPTATYVSKQNIAQIQFVVPQQGQGYRLRVNFKPNHKPCNMMLLSNNYDKVTLRNYGLARNCTAMSIYPQRVQFLYVNVGEKDKEDILFDTVYTPTPGLTTKCQGEAGEDSVQVFQGTGVGNIGRKMVLGFCGYRVGSLSRPVPLRCRSSSVRLQSSGQFYNTVRFTFLPTEEDDVTMC